MSCFVAMSSDSYSYVLMLLLYCSFRIFTPITHVYWSCGIPLLSFLLLLVHILCKVLGFHLIQVGSLDFWCYYFISCEVIVVGLIGKIQALSSKLKSNLTCVTAWTTLCLSLVKDCLSPYSYLKTFQLVVGLVISIGHIKAYSPF